MIFLQTSIIVFNSILQLLLISLIAGVLSRKGVISESQTKALAEITINIFLPSLIIAKTVTNFHPDAFPNWWIFPVSGIMLILIGFLFSGILYKLAPEKRPMMILSSIQNAVYIILPIGQVLFPREFDRFAIYCFLMLLGLAPIMWSIGKIMLSGNKKQKLLLKDFITPPLIATLISMAIVLTNLSSFIPGLFMETFKFLGDATVPLAIFIMGATIGSISLKHIPPVKDILIVAFVKFILIPVTVFTGLYLTNLHHKMPLFCNFMILQAAAPPAANLILIVKKYSHNTESVSGMMLIQYLIAIPAIPLWIATWQYFAQ